MPPGGLLRRRHHLRLTRDDRVWPDDPRAAASVHALESRLAAVRAGLSPIDALSLSELMDGSGGVPRS
ncbi:MAG: hypothetical protein IV088_08705 [Hydrogenophaga sp.]|uniref:hypothetical protein n=1 Tax=Hydrogenophaga sp. TaxID=1904254 RepID=UPI0025B83675|nr:hypothetical protein [Hydrogenophaga sp.]MBT9550913.1 hypothetical protein [Hydrogenophaga sp.]